MNEETTTEPKRKKEPREGAAKGTRPAHTVREGAIAANIWLRQTQTGLPYYEYSLSRSYKSMTTDKSGYASNFFSRNESALVNVIQQASQWIADAELREAAAAGQTLAA